MSDGRSESGADSADDRSQDDDVSQVESQKSNAKP